MNGSSAVLAVEEMSRPKELVLDQEIVFSKLSSDAVLQLVVLVQEIIKSSYH